MKLLTVHIEVADEASEEGFSLLVEELAEHLVSSDRQTLTVRLKEFPGLSGGL